MSTDNFGALGADFFIKTFNKGSSMSQADLDALVQYVQLTSTIMAIGDFTPNQQDSVWMILERVDVPSAPGYTVTNNTEVTMTSGGMVTIDSIPWTKVTGKPTLFTANQTLNTSDSVSFNRLTVTGASGIEGGEIELAKAPTSTLAGNVVIDVYENKLRFFEGGGNGRGFYLDLTTGANNTSTNIMSGGGGSDHEAYEITNTSASGTTYSVSVGTDGMISFPVIDGERTLWGAVDEDFNIKTTRTEPGIDADISILSADDIWMEAGDDIDLKADGTVRITSDNTGSGHQWRFGTDGDLTLPSGGTITEDGGLTGAIKLTPIGGANEYQALVIYPTGTVDGDHVHLTAGGGTTELYLGNDSHYVKLVNGGNVEIKATTPSDSATAAWTFDTDGDLTAPGNIILNNPVTTVTESVTGTVADSNGNPFTFRILKADNPQLVIPFADPNFVLKWTGSDAGSQAAAAQAPGGQGPSSLVSDDGTYWNFNSWFGLNTSRPTNGTVFTVEYGVVVNDTSISTTATNLVIEADDKQWTFGTDGDLTLPAGGDIVDSTGAIAFVSLATLKQVVAASTDFADFQTRIAGM